MKTLLELIGKNSSYMKDLHRENFIQGECVEQLINLVSEMSKFTPHNITEYATLETQKIIDKYCGNKQFQLQ